LLFILINLIEVIAGTRFHVSFLIDLVLNGNEEMNLLVLSYFVLLYLLEMK
jgi:hypothetical protein